MFLFVCFFGLLFFKLCDGFDCLFAFILFYFFHCFVLPFVSGRKCTFYEVLKVRFHPKIYLYFYFYTMKILTIYS